MVMARAPLAGWYDPNCGTSMPSEAVHPICCAFSAANSVGA